MGDEGLEGFNADPALGLPLRLALTYYAPDRDIARLYAGWSVLAQVPQRYEGALSPDKQTLLRSYRVALSEDLITRLRAGILIARGFPPGSLSLVTIPPEWWTAVHLDIKGNTVDAHGSRIQGVLIFAAASAIEPIDARLDKARDWMRANVTRPGQWKRDGAIAACSEATGIPQLVCRQAWDGLDGPLRGSRGVRKPQIG